ncbi:hypothetical protein M408DRAFT_331984 [Serendipita vermifera MAFF 305830]|uniref:Phospholipase C/P1 nuclease n=1 Tax=Serendipita vermifera MAFF 305830 TaxID=933852 RepID=A0A0C2X3Z4_SERVB|nr:hypothetical protein M408DRAFT_331984 [Serendipita vermifera MAFF 305830]
MKMGIKHRATAALALFSFNSLQVNAWGAGGHEITATIAQIYLHPSVLPQICALVYPYTPPKEPCHLAPIATWADRIRGLAQYRWAAPFHYVGGTSDWPPNKCVFGEDGWEGKDGVNVLGGIWNTTQWLKDGRPGAAEAVKFLIHFLGDLHQPLHMTARQRGGNDIKVHFHHRITNLHSVWDSRLLSNSILDTPHNYTRPLPSPRVEAALRGAIYDPLIRSIIWEGLLQAWKDDLEEWISCPTLDSRSGPSIENQQLPLGSSVSIAEHDARRWDDDFVCPYHWAKPTAALNCEITFPEELDWAPNSTDPHPAIELDTPRYAGKIRKRRILEKQLAQGGIRTAAVLNGLFANEDTKQTGFLYIPEV